jgi:RimJ/RimL family protein N-acetyltransferase
MKKLEKLITLRLVESSDYRFLYDLLKERDPNANISHKKMPSFSEHVKFVSTKPYSKWYIIESDHEKAGSIYLSKNDEIGIFIKKSFHKTGIGKIAINHLIKKNPRNRYLANVSPKNKKSLKFFKNNSFNLIQYTFEFKN